MNSVRMPGQVQVSPQILDARDAPTTPSRRVSVIDRSKVDPQIVKAAEGMEELFLDYMMQVMRKSVPESELSPRSRATEIYQGMLDSEYAKTAAHTGGIGLADMIIAYLDSGHDSPQNLKRARASVPRGQGSESAGKKPEDSKVSEQAPLPRTGGTQ